MKNLILKISEKINKTDDKKFTLIVMSIATIIYTMDIIMLFLGKTHTWTNIPLLVCFVSIMVIAFYIRNKEFISNFISKAKSNSKGSCSLE